MNILFGIPPADGWARAARHLGHAGFVLDPGRAFDSFHAADPDLVVVDMAHLSARGRTPVGECLRRWDRARLAVLCRPGAEGHPPRPYDLLLCDDPDHPDYNLRPAADCPPDYPGGAARPEFGCDVAVVGTHRPEYDRFVLALAAAGVGLKVFGHGPWPVAQYLGHLPAQDLPDVYASAGCVADLDGSPSRVLAVWAAGGYPVSVRRWERSDVVGLSDCPHAPSEDDLVGHVRVVAETEKIRVPSSRKAVLFTRQRDTLVNRLRDMLGAVGRE